MNTAKTYKYTARILLTAGKTLIRLQLSRTYVNIWKSKTTKRDIYRPLILLCELPFKKYQAFKNRHSSLKLMSRIPWLGTTSTQVKLWKLKLTKKGISRPLFLPCRPLIKRYKAFKFRHSCSKLMSKTINTYS